MRQKNDDTLTKLGDIFHYIIVLEKCLQMKEKEKIIVEQYGDLSKVSHENSENIEIKHHTSEMNFADRNVEFWKSLKNWLENYDNVKQFKKLMLLTTSTIKVDSIFFEWNSINKEKRFAIVKQVGSEKKEKEQQFRDYYNKIFSFPKSKILCVLERMELVTSETGIKKRKRELMQEPVFMLISEEYADSFINELLGHILLLPSEPPHSWVINYDDFKKKANEIRDRFSKGTRPLPDSFRRQEPLDTERYLERNFVTAIHEIEYLSEVNTAIRNYWRAIQTIVNYFQDNPIFLDDIEGYKDDLTDKLNRLKRIAMRRQLSPEMNDVIIKSQDFYDEIMSLGAEPFGTISPNRNFFQQGIIHEIVDEQKLNWYLGDEMNEH